MVKKANGKWKICINYKDLNKACSKNNSFLSRIDQLINATSNHKLLNFIDAFSSYNQIQIAPEDEENIIFIIERCLYCYKMISFDLKNIGATFQHFINKIFKQQIGQNMEVYVDDMII